MRLFLLVLALLPIACAGPGTTRSGFLESYDDLQASPKGGDGEVWAASPDALSGFDRILLEPVEFWTEPGAEGGLRAEDVGGLSKRFHDAFRSELTGSYPLVNQPGEGVLRVRAAVTRLVPTRPVLNTLTQAPPVRMASMGAKLLTGTHLGIGHVAIEAEFSDSQTGEVLARFVDVHVGSKLEVLDGMTKWNQVEDGFENWAAGLREHLDEHSATK